MTIGKKNNSQITKRWGGELKKIIDKISAMGTTKIATGVLFFLLGIFVTVFLAGKITAKDREEEIIVDIERDYINVLNLDENYLFDDPKEVIDFNNSIVKILYSGNMDSIEEVDIDFLVEKQRLLFSKELLDNNTKAEHISLVKNEVENYAMNNIKLMDVRTNSLDFENDKETIATAIITQIFSDGYNYTMKYHLINRDGNFKILAWEVLQEGQTETE